MLLSEIVEAGYLYTYTVFVDGTHIKANANNKKVIKEEVEVEAKRYAEELMQEVNADRIAHGKKPFDTGKKKLRRKTTMIRPPHPRRKETILLKRS